MGYTMSQFLDALEAVESGGVCNAVGDMGKSIGPLQIGRAYYRDAWGTEEGYEELATAPAGTAPNDETARLKSRQTAKRYMKRYAGGCAATANASVAELRHLEAMARVHNGGPAACRVGHAQWAATTGYWGKVEKQIAKLRPAGSEQA